MTEHSTESATLEAAPPETEPAVEAAESPRAEPESEATAPNPADVEATAADESGNDVTTPGEPEVEAPAPDESESAPTNPAEAEAGATSPEEPETEATSPSESESEPTAPAESKAETEPENGAAASKGSKSESPKAPAGDSVAPAVLELKQRMKDQAVVKGKVIGWNKGGFHVVCESVTAFCPNSEMELGKVRAPKDYLDKSYDFAVLRIEDSGRRVVLSRNKVLQRGRSQKRAELREKIQAGAEIEGRVASLTKFGAFVDVGGVQGLVHVSEISRDRVADPADVLSVGQKVKVKVLKVEQGGKRISLSMKALQPDPWKGVAEKFPEGSVVQGTVERTASFGAFIALEPGLTGLLPASVMNLPRDASIARMYSPGKELSVMVMSVDPRRRRISLALEGSQTEGSRSDFEKFKKSQQSESAGGFNALAAAFQKIQKPG